MAFTLQEAAIALNQCVRIELRDHAFGDAEVVFYKKGDIDEEGTAKEGAVMIAEGYIGRECSISVYDEFLDGVEPAWTEFTGKEAAELLRCGVVGRVERNDTTGPDEFRPGVCLPGLTLEGVAQELIDKGVFVRK